MDEPTFTNPPQVTDRRDRLWTKYSPGTWRWVKVRQNGRMFAFYMTWEELEEFNGPLVLVTTGFIPVPEPTPDGTPVP